MTWERGRSIILQFNQSALFMNRTLKTTSAEWLAARRPFIRPSSYAIYSVILKKHILPAFGERTSAQIGEGEVQEFILRKFADGMSLKSVRGLVTVLKMVVSHDLKAKPQWLLNYPDSPRRPLSLLSAQSHRALIRYAQENFSFKNLGILICLTSGLRIGEVCALQWQDIDLREGTVRITKSASRLYDPERRTSRLTVGRPKTLSSQREVPLPGFVIKALRPMVKKATPEFFILSNAPVPIDPRVYRYYYIRLLERLGIPYVKFHGMRHSFATRCIESRCDCKTVSSILGHSSVTTTYDLYVHPGISQKRRCVEHMMVKVLGK